MLFFFPILHTQYLFVTLFLKVRPLTVLLLTDELEFV